jgi:hypothetical protein
MGAGVLPIAIKNNQIYFLFGKENKYNDTPGWADFGGGIEEKENILNSAVREGWEESTGFLGTPQEMKKIIIKNNKMCLDIPNYKTFLLPIKYDEKMVEYFNKSQYCIQNNLSKEIIEKTFIFEKQEIKWFRLEDLEQKIKLFRPFYQEIIKIILEKKILFKSIFKTRNKTKKIKE